MSLDITQCDWSDCLGLNNLECQFVSEFESGRLERDDGRGRPSVALASTGQLVALCLREPHGDAERRSADE